MKSEKKLKNYVIDKLIAALMCKCGFGDVIFPIKSVSGGYVHRMYKVKTNSGTYAVKHLNPEIIGRKGALDDFERAEKLEYLLEKEDIPIVPALTFFGKKMQNVGGHCFYIYNWQNGHITDWNHISNEVCNIAGNLLGRIHAIAPRNTSHEEPRLSNINWQWYIKKASNQKSEIAFVLSDNLQLLTYAEKELNMARASLPDIICVSNGDMDPKNIMWDKGKPWIIDLECLNYGNPVSDVLQLALQWSGIVTCNMNVEKMVAFFKGYLEVYDNSFREYGNVLGLAYTWIEWLEYNTQRALGLCGDEKERSLGISEVKNTVNRIKCIHDNEREIKDALYFRLPEIEADRK